MVKQAWFPLQWIAFKCKNYYESIKDANKLNAKLNVSYNMQHNWASCSHYESNEFSILSIVCHNRILLIESATYDVELASETIYLFIYLFRYKYLPQRAKYWETYWLKLKINDNKQILKSS